MPGWRRHVERRDGVSGGAEASAVAHRAGPTFVACNSPEDTSGRCFLAGADWVLSRTRTATGRGRGARLIRVEAGAERGCPRARGWTFPAAGVGVRRFGLALTDDGGMELFSNGWRATAGTERVRGRGATIGALPQHSVSDNVSGGGVGTRDSRVHGQEREQETAYGLGCPATARRQAKAPALCIRQRR